MRRQTRKGPFRMLDVAFEPVSYDEAAALTRAFQRIHILSHRPLLLPPSFGCIQKKTPNIHVADGPEAVFRRFRDTARNEIRRTERLEGFEVRFPEAWTRAAYRLYAAFERAQGRPPLPLRYMRRFSLAVAFLEGRPLSAIAFYESETVLRVFAIFSERLAARGDRERYKLIGYASKRLVYELCLRAHAGGREIVDLASINLTDPGKASIAAFKSGFGAEIEDEYLYTYRSPLLARIVRATGILREKIHRLVR